MNDHQSSGGGWNLQALSNQELTRLYEQYDVCSVDFAAVRSEMVRRGFRFRDASPDEENLAVEESSVQIRGSQKLRYSKGWSLFWEILFMILGLILFAALMETAEWEPSTEIGLLFGLAAFLVFSLGALVSGVRNLANHKSRHPEAARSGAWQMILGVIWSLSGAGILYYGIRMVSQVLEWDEQAAVYIGAVSLSLCLVCVALAIALITLGREMGSAD